MTDDDQTNICYACIGDNYLREEVRQDGEKAECDYCGERQDCISLGELSERIHGVLEEHFSCTPSEPSGYEYALDKEGLWERAGEPVEYVIADIAGLDEVAARDVREYLSDQYGYGAVRDGDQDPYAQDACYEEKGADDWGLRESWSEFCREIRSRARFFSQYAREALGEIFGEISTLRTWRKKPAVREINPDDDDRYVYRARVALTDTEVQDILKNPTRGLGPPPSRNAKAGRMNAAGIPVFYGAMEIDTCVAEARAPVGSSVVIGQFEVIRPLRLLDFDVLTELYVEGSHFDPDYHARCARAAFLRRLVREISQPVLPRDEEFQYLPTQAVAEYLAGCVEPRLDGIIFRSSQTAGDGHNLILFNHACGVESYSLPAGTEFDFLMGWETEDDFDDSIAVFEILPPENPEKTPKPRSAFDPAAFTAVKEPLDWYEEAWNDPPGQHNPALRLDVEGVRVLGIQGVTYNYRKRRVSRHRKTKGGERFL